MIFDSRAVRPAYMARVADYPPGATFGPRLLHNFELVWLLSGSAVWSIGHPASVHTLVPGTIAVARAGLTDSYRWDVHQPSSHAYVHFEVDEDVEPHDWPLVRAMTAGEPLAALCAYLLVLARLGDEARQRSDDVVRLIVDIIVNDAASPVASEPSSPHVLQALDFVRTAWRRDGMRIVSLEELASAARVSPAHLSREFHREHARGFVSALELIRLGRAAIALQRSNLPLDRVARLVGFANPYHFSRRFSAAYGISPGRFRRAFPDADPLAPVAAAGLVPLWTALEAQAEGLDL